VSALEDLQGFRHCKIFDIGFRPYVSGFMAFGMPTEEIVKTLNLISKTLLNDETNISGSTFDHSVFGMPKITRDGCLLATSASSHMQ